MQYLRRLFLILYLLFFCNMAFAQSFPPLIVEEEDGSPTGVTTKIKVTNGALSRTGTVATITTGGGAAANDTVYGVGWNGSTDQAPSQNAVYDKIETISAGSGNVTNNGTIAENYFTVAGAAETEIKNSSYSTTDAANWNTAYSWNDHAGAGYHTSDQGTNTTDDVTFNSTSGNFTGPLTGEVTGNTSGSSGSCTGNAATASAVEWANVQNSTHYHNDTYYTETEVNAIDGLSNYYNKTETAALHTLTNFYNKTETVALHNLTNFHNKTEAAATFEPAGVAVADITDASANGRSLISAANYATMRGLLDLEAGTDFYSTSAADTLLAAKLAIADFNASWNTSLGIMTEGQIPNYKIVGDDMKNDTVTAQQVNEATLLLTNQTKTISLYNWNSTGIWKGPRFPRNVTIKSFTGQTTNLNLTATLVNYNTSGGTPVNMNATNLYTTTQLYLTSFTDSAIALNESIGFNISAINGPTNFTGTIVYDEAL